MTNWMRRTATLSAGLVLAGGAALATAPTASALVSGPLHPASSGKCLGVYGMSTDNGTDAVQWDCNGNADQRWSYSGVGGGYYTITNANSGKCLGVYGMDRKNGAVAVQWDCNGNADQQWYIDSVGNGAAHLINRNSGKCLGVYGGNTANGTLAVQWDCNGNSDQVWYS
ncbi:RICIN domain-containing protein [Kitasatospora sp. DSM 101779]|jgi:hypothetical protein|uniref:RICIN domain-containing protein n=1 Tax=Kitasatospora sp. DSM 101779 TaxID=2853165 RepID=UPI0021D7EF35|nr:RICIN domain-containing protein [Kitasatospora sp. DSM 101779]MCU7823619.1 RICIN domain-containing protein [Kitasatospora sp. DSM 101779]